MKEKIYKTKKGEAYRYRIMSNFKYIIKTVHRYDKWFLIVFLFWVPCAAFIDLIWSLFNKHVVNFALGIGDKRVMLITMGIILFIGLCLTLCDGILNSKIWNLKYEKLRYNLNNALLKKKIDTDYENLENTETMNLYHWAETACSMFNQLWWRIREFVHSVISLLGWGAIIATLSPWLILIIVCPTFLFYKCMQIKINWNEKNKDKWIPIERKINYVTKKSTDFAVAKDIRLYRMENWFGSMFKKFLEERIWWYKKQGKVDFWTGLLMLLVAMIRDIAAYGFIIWQLYKGDMTPGDFMLYMSCVGVIANSFFNIIDNVINFKWMSYYVSWYREFLELPDKTNRGKGRELPTSDFDIRFENVSYQYGGAEQSTLKNLNFTIKSGERIAVVGKNGAGKTTLVKLICGIYHRTSGEIYINNFPISDYNRDELYKIFATVFQDIHVMPCTIAENIAMSDEYNKQNLEYAIFHSGIEEKVNSLPEKHNTHMVKTVYEKATDFSGGEMQKIALARALYKQKTQNTKILILDEPTAALDPIAEQNMYHEYSRFSQGKTAIFISHRLASTQFCHRIFYLSNGEITEEGTHRQLLDLGGEYAEIFNIQSQYYREVEHSE